MDQTRARRLGEITLVLLCVAAALVFFRSGLIAVGPDHIAAWLAPHRHAWYALPAIMAGFVALAMLPVVLLIAATGLAFGPVLGPLYAMAGCLASASAAFALGRRLGRRRIERWGGPRIATLTRTVARNGTLAVFLIRKVPAPFVLANVVIGASPIGYREFVIGTVLGMGVLVIALAGFGAQLIEVWRDPSPSALARAAVLFAVPLAAALIINRFLRDRADDRAR
jgi:phospholipase D1/2